jgi:nucleoside-diphosphate-sugar epimerase
VINFATLYKNTHLSSEIPKFIKSNITFPTIILDTISKDTKKFINFGTMMQHLDGKNHVPKNFYASTKSAFEMILNYFLIINKKLKFYNLKFYESFSEIDSRDKLIPTLYKNYKKNKITFVNTNKLELNIIHTQDILKAIYTIFNNDIASGDYCLKNEKNIKIKNLIKSINNKSNKKIKVKFLGNNLNKPQKNLLKILPKWKADITIQNKIKNKFLNENN